MLPAVAENANDMRNMVAVVAESVF
jgi:hypothetical protein